MSIKHVTKGFIPLDLHISMKYVQFKESIVNNNKLHILCKCNMPICCWTSLSLLFFFHLWFRGKIHDMGYVRLLKRGQFSRPSQKEQQ